MIRINKNTQHELKRVNTNWKTNMTKKQKTMKRTNDTKKIKDNGGIQKNSFMTIDLRVWDQQVPATKAEEAKWHRENWQALPKGHERESAEIFEYCA